MSEIETQTEGLEEPSGQNDAPLELDPNLEYVEEGMEFIDTRDLSWPYSMFQIRRRETNYTFAPVPDLDFLKSAGYMVIRDSEIPTGDVVTQVTPVLIEDQWYRAYSVRSFTPEEIEAALNAERQVRLQLLGERLVERLAQGYESSIRGTTQHLNLSDVNASDLGDQLRRAQSALDRGASTTFRIRTIENQTFTLNAQETVDLIDAALAERQRIRELSWDLEDLLNMAEVMEDLPEIPAVLD